MLDNITLGRYYLKNSVVHKLNPVFKILSVIIMIISIFFIDSYIGILMLSSYLLLSIVYSDIGMNIETFLGIKEYVHLQSSVDVVDTE